MKIRRMAMIVACLALVFVGAAPMARAAQKQGWVVIKMTAQRYKFTPKVISVHQGDHVRLIITALDRDHGFELKEYGINQRLKKGDPTTIEFTADKAGTFTFRCSVFCGLGHMRMKGKLIVKPAAGPAATGR
jgi:cytochrome c oxidase subunit II